jgi:hypothetical protein
MDSDMIAMADIAELWTQPIPRGKALLAKGGTQVISCVMLMDCAALRSRLQHVEPRSVQGKYWEVCDEIADVTANYTGNWNCRDGEHYASIYDPDVKILHYSSIPTQPNHRRARARLAAEGKPHWYAGPVSHIRVARFRALFDATLTEAIAAGSRPTTFSRH